MKSTGTYLLLLLLVAAGCSKRQTTQIVDATKPATLTLTPAKWQGTSVHYLALNVSGEIEGVAEIWGSELPTNRVTGRFEIKRDGDYYTTNFVVNYRPEEVRAGQISIKYEFRCID